MSANANDVKALHSGCWESDLRFKEIDGNLAEILKAKAMREKHGRVFINIILCPASHPSLNSPKKGVWRPFLSANILTSLHLFQFPFQNITESKHGRDRGTPHTLKESMFFLSANSSSPMDADTWPPGLGSPLPASLGHFHVRCSRSSPIKATPPPSPFQGQRKCRRPKPDTQGCHTCTRWADGNR